MKKKNWLVYFLILASLWLGGDFVQAADDSAKTNVNVGFIEKKKDPGQENPILPIPSIPKEIGKILPNTGEKATIYVVAIGLGLVAYVVWHRKKKIAEKR